MKMSLLQSYFWLSALGLSLMQSGMTQPLNLDFEISTPAGRALGWYVESGSGVWVNKDTPASGLQSLTLENHADDPLVLYTSLPPLNSCLQSIRFSIQARSKAPLKLALVYLDGSSATGPVISAPQALSE